MELELKHLCAYLPFGITLYYIIQNKVAGCGKLKAIVHDEYATHPTKVKTDSSEYEHIWMFKPCLKPISKLTLKELEDDAQFPKSIAFYALQSAKKNDLSQTPYFVVEYLLSQHYDIFGLIEAGLAVEKE